MGKGDKSMGTVIDHKLEEIGAIIQDGLDTEGTLRILRLIEISAYTKELMEDLTLYSELLPLAREKPFTLEQRYLHFLWDALDKLPICRTGKSASPDPWRPRQFTQLLLPQHGAFC